MFAEEDEDRKVDQNSFIAPMVEKFPREYRSPPNPRSA